MENSEKLVRQLNALSKDEKKEVLVRQAKERLHKKLVIKELTNAQILELPQFNEFCSERKIEPSKRQAGKHKHEFVEWYEQKYRDRDIGLTIL